MNPNQDDEHPPAGEAGYSNEGGETSGGREDAEGPSAYGPTDVPYDPGAAFIDENQRYGQVYEDSGQAHVAPGQVDADPGSAHVDPGQAYVDPGQAYVESAAGYSGTEEILSGGGIYDEGASVPQAVPQRTSGRSVGRKKVGGRAPRRQPVVPRRSAAASRLRRSRPRYRSEGFSVMTVFLALLAVGMLALIAVVMLPRDISSISGYPVSAATSAQSRNLLAELQGIMTVKGTSVSFTEREVNEYLNMRLLGEQEGMLGGFVKFKGVYVDFSPEVAEFYIEREVFGKTLTMSSKVRTEKFRQQTVYRSAGFTLGRIELSSRTFKPVMDLFLRLRSACQDEFHAIQFMSDVVFEEGKVTFYSII